MWRMTCLILSLSLLLLAAGSLVSVNSTRARAALVQVVSQGSTVNLRDFGAVGDGTTNDGPALQRALDALWDSGGGTLVVPAGRYVIATPVAKDFSGQNESLAIRGVASSVAINTKGSGDELTRGLGLTSGFTIKTGASAVALALGGLNNLTITDMYFIGTTGTPTEANDALVTLYLGGIPNATIRHCEFYGLISQNWGGAIVAADSTGLTIDQTAFLGCTGNSGVRASVVQVTNWKSLSVTESVFADYGQRPELFSKTGYAAAYSWVMIANAAAPTDSTTRRVAAIRNVFMDEGGFMAVASIPDFFDQQSVTADLLYLSDMRVNVSSLGVSGMYFARAARHVMLERISYELTHNADVAVNLFNAGDAILDRLSCVPAVNRLRADASTGKLTVINSPTCDQVQSQAQSTSVLSFAPDDDPVQFVRHQYLAALGVEPDPAAHYDWSNSILLCGTDQTCASARRAELTTLLSIPAAPSFLSYDGVAIVWQDNSANETGFKIERATGSGVWTQIATVAANTTRFPAPAFVQGSSPNSLDAVSYRVRASNGSGDSPYSNEVCPSCVNQVTATPTPVAGDDFNDNSLDASKWTVYYPQSSPTVSEQSQSLQIALAPNTAGYNGVYSNVTYDLTSRMAQVEAVQPVSQAGWCETFFKVALDANNYYLIDAGATSLNLRATVGGGNDTTIINYDPAAHRFWRIRHDQNGNTINFETSPDDATWTTRKTVPATFSLAAMRVHFVAGAWGTGNAAPGAARYDNFKIIAGTTGTGARIPNYGFEAPAVGYGVFRYNPTGGTWTFAGGSGVTGNASGFTGGAPNAPEGGQAAFLQGGNTSIISQTISGFRSDKTYIVTFAATQRRNCCNAGGQDFQVYLDNTLLGTFRPATGSYVYYSTPAFSTTAGAHVVKFVGLDSSGGDNTAFIDNVRVTVSTGW